MAQNYYSFGGYTPSRQPDSVEFSLATTSTADSGRNQLGAMDNSVMFTVEQYKVTFTRLGAYDTKKMLQAITGKNSIAFHYFSPYYGEWQDAQFYVANNTLKIKSVVEKKEVFNNMNFQITGINPI